MIIDWYCHSYEWVFAAVTLRWNSNSASIMPPRFQRFNVSLHKIHGRNLYETKIIAVHWNSEPCLCASRLTSSIESGASPRREEKPSLSFHGTDKFVNEASPNFLSVLGFLFCLKLGESRDTKKTGRIFVESQLCSDFKKLTQIKDKKNIIFHHASQQN